MIIKKKSEQNSDGTRLYLHLGLSAVGTRARLIHADTSRRRSVANNAVIGANFRRAVSF